MKRVSLALAVMVMLGPIAPAQSARAARHDASPQYKISGAASLRPSRIWDDGQHTFIIWPAEAELPAVFSIGADGREVLADGAMRDGNYVLDRVHNALVFRIDQSVAKAVRRGAHHE